MRVVLPQLCLSRRLTPGARCQQIKLLPMKTREAGLLRKDFFLLAAWSPFPSCLHGALSFSLPSEAVYSVDMGLAVNWMPLPTFAKADLPTWQCYAVWTFFAAWGMSPSTAAALISVGWPDRGSSQNRLLTWLA